MRALRKEKGRDHRRESVTYQFYLNLCTAAQLHLNSERILRLKAQGESVSGPFIALRCISIQDQGKSIVMQFNAILSAFYNQKIKGRVCLDVAFKAFETFSSVWHSQSGLVGFKGNELSIE